MFDFLKDDTKSEHRENIEYYLAGQPDLGGVLEEAKAIKQVAENMAEIIDPGMPLGACLMLTCKGCNKLVSDDCSVYANPAKLMWHRQDKHCPFNPPVVETKKKKVLNPIKASKRSSH